MSIILYESHFFKCNLQGRGVTAAKGI